MFSDHGVSLDNSCNKWNWAISTTWRHTTFIKCDNDIKLHRYVTIDYHWLTDVVEVQRESLHCALNASIRRLFTAGISALFTCNDGYTVSYAANIRFHNIAYESRIFGLTGLKNASHFL